MRFNNAAIRTSNIQTGSYSKPLSIIAGIQSWVSKYKVAQFPRQVSSKPSTVISLVSLMLGFYESEAGIVEEAFQVAKFCDDLFDAVFLCCHLTTGRLESIQREHLHFAVL